MVEKTDSALLEDYTLRNSQEAFTALVQRHLNLVYSVAMRHLQNPAQAEEVAQAVFTILAQKASGLHKSTILQGWLYQAARLTSLRLCRDEMLRRRREQEAQMEHAAEEAQKEPDWKELSPLLDEAMGRLGDDERNALLLRFFEGRSFAEVAAAAGASQAAVQKRVERGIEKLRAFFVRRGVKIGAGALVGAISANSVQAAPAGLAQSVGTAAAAKGLALSHSTLTLIKGTLKIMAWTKAKTAAVTAAAIILATGTTTVIVKETVFSEPSTQTRLEKAPQIATGGLNKAHSSPRKVFTYPEGDQRTRRHVEAMIERFYKDVAPTPDIKTDRELTEKDMQEATIYVYGSPENHSFLSEVREQLPLVFESDGIVVGNQKFKGRDVGAIFVCPNPRNPKHQLVVYGTVSPEALVEMNAVFHGPTDYVVFNDTTRHFKTDAIEQYLVLGSFDKSDPSHWRVDEKLQLRPGRALQKATARVVVARRTN